MKTAYVRLLIGGALSVALSLSASVPARAEYEAQQAAVKDYALKAMAVYKAIGPQAAATEFMDTKKWLEPADHFSLHIGLVTNDETVLADSGFPELVGLNYNEVSDLDGLSLGKNITAGVQRSPDGVALHHRFANPNTKAAAHAEGYCMQADEQHILCAWSQAG